MKIAFITSLLIGLLAGVRVMIKGVERPRAWGSSEPGELRVSPAVVAVVAIVFGGSGALLMRLGSGAVEAALGAALVAGIAGAATVRVVKKWWTAPVEHDVEDPRYILQGHLAEVVAPIAGDHEGEIAFQIDDQRRVCRARSLEGRDLPVGTEVVIERLEDDVAFVEEWAQVERRL